METNCSWSSSQASSQLRFSYAAVPCRCKTRGSFPRWVGACPQSVSGLRTERGRQRLGESRGIAPRSAKRSSDFTASALRYRDCRREMRKPRSDPAPRGGRLLPSDRYPSESSSRNPIAPNRGGEAESIHQPLKGEVEGLLVFVKVAGHLQAETPVPVSSASSHCGRQTDGADLLRNRRHRGRLDPAFPTSVQARRSRAKEDDDVFLSCSAPACEVDMYRLR